MMWYDSIWLSAYYRALDIVARVAPSRLEDFVRSFDILRTDPGFSACALPQVLDAATIEELRQTVAAIPMEKMEMHEMRSFGRLVVHDLPEFTAIQQALVDQVSEWAGEDLECSYNFLALYSRMGECRPHLDSPSAKWTLDICLAQTEPWALHISQVVPWPARDMRLSDDWVGDIKTNTSLDFRQHLLEPGDAVLFSGSSQWHYRDALPRDGAIRHCDLLFMHFIPKGAGRIVCPANWPSIFDVPELSDVAVTEAR